MRIYYAIVILLCFYSGFSQHMPANYSSLPSTHNMVRNYIVLQPGVTPTQITNTNADPRVVQLTTAYFDGLGRPLQTVVRKGSLNTANGETAPKDLVHPKTYDDFGREKYQFLPFVHSASDGNFKGGTTQATNPFEMQKVFYTQAQVNLNPIAGQGETYFYSQTNFEPSPLNRIEKSLAPGNSWVGNNRGVEQRYFFNTLIDSVRIWNVTDVGLGVFGTYATPAGAGGIYPAGQLYKLITTDEHGKQVIEFKDKSGQIILKKVQIGVETDNGNGSDYNPLNWICTYYIYDDLGNLRCVVQPEGVKWLATPAVNWKFSATNGSTILAEQCFRYEYDQRRRMIVKKVPGAAEVTMVYDNSDRLVATQTGNMRSNSSSSNWLVTWYDGLNRPIKSGLCAVANETGSAATRRNGLIAGAAAATEAGNFMPPNSTAMTVYTENFYDTYAALPGLSGHSLTATFDNVPGALAQNNVDYPYVRAFPTTLGLAVGMPTISRTLILGSTLFITTVTLYDAEGRVVQVKTYNGQDQITDIASTQYGFAGQPVRVYQQQRVQASGGAQTLATTTRYYFDGIGRVSHVTKQHGHVYSATTVPALSAEKVISRTLYDALGNVKEKSVGVANLAANATALEKMNYDYNIRGWLLGVNRDFVATANTAAPMAGKWFGFDLGYDKTANPTGNGYLKAQFNGNISGQSWRSAGDNAARQYRYSYDAANRIMMADFVQRQTFESGFNKSFNFDSKMGTDGLTPETAYDLNGNIKMMQQWGWTAFNPQGQIDNLQYDYITNSNKLNTVSEFISASPDLGDFKNTNSSNITNGYGVNQPSGLTILNNNGYNSSTQLISSAVNNFTVELWVKPTSTHQIDVESNFSTSGTSGQKYVIDPVWGGSNGDAGMGISVGTNGISVYEHADFYMPALLVWQGTVTGWTHIAVVYQNKTPKLYVNGVLVKTGLTSVMTNVMPGTLIASAVYNTMDGEVDEVRVWNTVRTAAQLTQFMNRTVNSPQTGLVAYWPIRSSGDGSILEDISGNNYNVQLNGYSTQQFGGTGAPIQAPAAYRYDANGNLIADLNKRIGVGSTNGISYNHLNLPVTITVRTPTGTVKGTITYMYNAAGVKIRKTVIEYGVTVAVGNTPYADVNITTTTFYAGGQVYESKAYTNSTVGTALGYHWQLQHVAHEEGRMRAVRPTPQSKAAIALPYDYMLKDHLGNVRMVLTDEEQTIRYPAATLEGTFDSATNSLVNHEAKFFKIDGTKITDEANIPSWNSETGTTKDYFNHNGNPPANDQYPSGVTPASTAKSSKLYRLNATENKTGLEFMLKVMAGDKVDIFGNSYYLNTAQINNANSTPLDYAAILAGWLAVPGGGLAGKGVTAGQLNTLNNGLIPASFIRGNNNEPPTTVPKAYINYLFFDEQFRFVSGGSSRVGSSGVLKRHWYEDGGLQNIAVSKNGYIFVYVSNESNLNVFFDNIQVIHKPGPLLEETHYYPFGLTMAGISSKAAGKLENNKEKFQGQPLDDDLGLNWYGFKWRNHDPQIGRFIEIDPLSEKYVHNSTYAFSENKVTSHVELEGLEAVVAITGITVSKGKASSQRGDYFLYRVDIYEGMTIDRYNQLKSSGHLGSPTASSLLARDAWARSSKRSNKRYGTSNETPPGTYFLSYRSSGYGKKGYKLKVSSTKEGDFIDGPDGRREGIRIHHYSPHFSLGCFTTGDNSKGSVDDFINLIPSLEEGEDVRLVVEERQVDQDEDDGLFRGIQYKNNNEHRSFEDSYRNFINKKIKMMMNQMKRFEKNFGGQKIDNTRVNL